MKPNEVVKLNEQTVESWNQHDANKFASYLDESVVCRELGVTEPYRGKSGAKDFLNNWIKAFPDFRIKILNTVAAEDTVAMELEITGSNSGPIRMGDAPEIPATNKRITIKGSCFGRVKNGKFIEINAYPDLAGILTQLGVFQELHA